MSENFALLFLYILFGERDPRVPGEKGRLIGIEPLKEYVQIGESQFLIEPGNLSESWGLVYFAPMTFSNNKFNFTAIQFLHNEQ